MRRFLRAASALFLAIGALAACGNESESVDGWGLDTIDLHEIGDRIPDLVDAMPETLDGYRLVGNTDASVHQAEYTDGSAGPFVAAQPSAARGGTDTAPVTPGEWVRATAESGAYTILGSDLHSSTVWLHAMLSSEGRSAHVLLWGEDEGEWLLFFTAESQDALDLIVTTFVERARPA